MRRGKYLLLAGALILAMALPASAAERISDSAGATKNVVIEVPDKVDKTGPVIKDFALSTTKIYSNKDTKIKAYLKISDNLSGLNYAIINFKNEKGRYCSFSVFKDTCVYDKNKKAYIAEVELLGDSCIGTFKFDKAYLYDLTDNVSVYSPEDSNTPRSLRKATFKVAKGKEKAKASVSDFSFAKKTISFKSADTKAKSCETVLKLKTSGSKVKYVDVSFKGIKADGKVEFKLFENVTLNSEQKAIMTLKFENSDKDVATWMLNWIDVHFENGEVIELTTEKIGSKYANKKLNVTSSGTIKDTSFPRIKSAKFKERNLKLGSKKEGIVNLELNVYDKGSGVSFIFLTFRSKDNRQIYKGITLDKPKKSGKIIIPISIYRGVAPGEYKLSEIRIKDLAGYETDYMPYGGGINTNPMVRNLQFISDMKDMKLTLKSAKKK